MNTQSQTPTPFGYYVTFVHQGPSGPAFASLDISAPKRISTVADLTPITNQLTARGYSNVLILAFSLYAKPNPAPNRTTSTPDNTGPQRPDRRPTHRPRRSA